MPKSFMLNVALVIFVMQSRAAHAEPIGLLSYEGGAYTNTTVGDATGIGSVPLPWHLPLTLNYSSQGGTVEFLGGEINSSWSGDSTQKFPVDSQFYVNLASLVPGSQDQYQGPELDISGEATGILAVDPETYPRWSGGYSGTATSASLWPLGSQDLSLLPAPLLDILHHPDHFHFSVTVTGGSYNYLDVKLTFDPSSALETPEPTALLTLVAGSAAWLFRRWRSRAA